MKTTRITHTNYLRTGYGEREISEESYLEAEINYDDNGHTLKETHYTSDGDIESVVENSFNEKGEIVSSAQYDENNELTQKNTFYYEDGKLMKKGCFYGEGSPEYLTQLVYENGLLIREDAYDDDELDYTEKRHEYNEDGLETLCIEYTEDQEIIYRTLSEYNEKGQLCKRHREEPLEHDSRTYTFEYDDNGLKTKELIFNYDQKLIAKAYFTYNENGNITEMEEENLDNYRRTCYSYQGTNCTKIELFDRDGTMLAWTEYTYNEYNEVILVKNYIQDEVDPEKYRISSSVQYDIEH